MSEFLPNQNEGESFVVPETENSEHEQPSRQNYSEVSTASSPEKEKTLDDSLNQEDRILLDEALKEKKSRIRSVDFRSFMAQSEAKYRSSHSSEINAARDLAQRRYLRTGNIVDRINSITGGHTTRASLTGIRELFAGYEAAGVPKSNLENPDEWEIRLSAVEAKIKQIEELKIDADPRLIEEYDRTLTEYQGLKDKILRIAFDMEEQGMERDVNEQPEQTLNPEKNRDQEVEAKLTYPELIGEADRSTNESSEKIAEASLTIETLGNIIRGVPEACRSLFYDNKRCVTELRELGASEETVSGMERLGGMLDRVAVRSSIASLIANIEQSFEKPIPEISSIDRGICNSLGPEEARKYTDGVIEENNKAARLIVEQRNRLVKLCEDELKSLTEIASNIHTAKKLVQEGPVQEVIERASSSFDAQLSSLFHIRRIDIQPGHVYDTTAINHTNALGLMEIDDPSLDNTIASVIGASYSFDPELSVSDDPFGDSIQEATVEVYRYKA